MTYAIVCDARRGRHIGLTTLALVDRNKTKEQWWTSHESHLILRLWDRQAAENRINKLSIGNPRIVMFEEAVKIIEDQETMIMQHEAEESAGEEYLNNQG